MSPPALFCFNRPTHTRETVKALASCPEAPGTDLYVFIDGPRTDDDKPQVDAVHDIFCNLPFRTLRVFRSEINKGLFRSITEGVSLVLSERMDVVVVEDDLVVSPHFLSYMSDGLERYRNANEVGSIHGYALPVDGLPDYFFLKGGDCWGWATWRDRWKLFLPEPMRLLELLVRTGALDEFMGTQGASSLKMLCKRAESRNQSWAILWHASLWLAGRLTLHPGKSFVRNIGVDGTGTHCDPETRFDVPLANSYEGLPDLRLTHDHAAAALVSDFLDEVGNQSFWGGCKRRLKRWTSALYARKVLWGAKP
jgi:hypothetical protein